MKQSVLIDFKKLPDKAPEYDLKDLLEAGCHFGHKTKKWNPKMDEFIYMDKEGIHIFDLAQTAEKLQQAYNYLYWLGKKNKAVIFLGTKRQAKGIIEKVTENSKLMYVTQRWLGGLITNWKQIKKSIKWMNNVEKNLKTDEYEGYTKFEVLQLKKELARKERFFGGIRDLRGNPDCLVVVDPVREQNAILEANQADVPVVALIDSNGDPNQVDIPIPANDDASGSIRFIISELAEAYKKGQEGK